MNKTILFTVSYLVLALGAQASELDNVETIKPENIPSSMVVRKNLETGIIELYQLEIDHQILTEEDALVAEALLEDQKPVFTIDKDKLEENKPVRSSEFDASGDTATQAWVNFWYNPVGYSSYYYNYSCQYSLTYYTPQYYYPYYNTYYRSNFYGYSYYYYYWR